MWAHWSWRSINVDMNESKYRARRSSWNTSLKQLIIQVHLKMLENENGPIYEHTTKVCSVVNILQRQSNTCTGLLQTQRVTGV
jgi:hypothetical protein